MFGTYIPNSRQGLGAAQSPRPPCQAQGSHLGPQESHDFSPWAWWVGEAPSLSTSARRTMPSILHPEFIQRGSAVGSSTDITVIASSLRINGHPGNYVRIAGKWRLEEVRELP